MVIVVFDDSRQLCRRHSMTWSEGSTIEREADRAGLDAATDPRGFKAGRHTASARSACREVCGTQSQIGLEA
jgi:hypothetical protein